MKTRVLGIVVLILVTLQPLLGQEAPQTLQLPRPDSTGGKPLLQALKERKSSRSFSDRKIPPQVLSHLLWAAFGVNRPDGRRTAPSARNRQEIEILLFMSEGVYLYDAKAHALNRITTGDLRAKTGMQDFVSEAPLNLVYVADMSTTGTQSAEEAAFYVGADCGFIAQNVYLYCASEGLGVVVRGLVDRNELKALVKLAPNQRILLAQTVGYLK